MLRNTIRRAASFRWGLVALLLGLPLPFVILAFFAIFYVYAPYVYFTLLSALPACLIVLTVRSAREYVLALKLTLLTAVLFGLGLGAAIAF